MAYIKENNMPKIRVEEKPTHVCIVGYLNRLDRQVLVYMDEDYNVNLLHHNESRLSAKFKYCPICGHIIRWSYVGTGFKHMPPRNEKRLTFRGKKWIVPNQDFNKGEDTQCEKEQE